MEPATTSSETIIEPTATSTATSTVVRHQLRTWLPLIGLGVVLLLVAVPSWPGRINADTVSMLRSIDTNTVTNWHSPLLQFLWMPFHKLGVGISGVLLIQIVVAFGGLLLIFETYGFSRTKSTVFAVGMCLHPVTYGLLCAVIRDAWFLSLYLVALGIGRTHRVRGARRVAAMAIVIFLAYAARQNAIVMAPVMMFVALSDGSWEFTRAWGWVRRSAAAVASTVVMIAVMTIALGILPVEKKYPEAVYLPDLVRLSLRSGEVLLPDEVNPYDLTIDELRDLATPWNVDRLLYVEKRVPDQLNDEQNAATRAAWVELIKDDPIEYLRMRWQVMTRQIGLGGPAWNSFQPAQIPNPYGIHSAFPSLAQRATDYQVSFNQGLNYWEAGAIHRAWVPFLGALVAAVAAALRRRGTALAFDVVASGFMVLLSVFVFAGQLQFRFVAPMVVASYVVIIGMFVPYRVTPRPVPVDDAVGDDTVADEDAAGSGEVLARSGEAAATSALSPESDG